MKRGEAVRCIVDYDLFDVNINGEWSELEPSQFELINKPGYIPVKNRKFVSCIKTLEYSY